MSVMHDLLPEPDPKSVAQRLRMYMGDKKLSRAKLAIAAGISRTSLGAKLDGTVPFTLDEIIAVARAIGQPWLWVLTGQGERPDPPGPGTGQPVGQPTPMPSAA